LRAYIGKYTDYQVYVPNSNELWELMDLDMNVATRWAQVLARDDPWLAKAYVA